MIYFRKKIFYKNVNNFFLRNFFIEKNNNYMKLKKNQSEQAYNEVVLIKNFN